MGDKNFYVASILYVLNYYMLCILYFPASKSNDHLSNFFIYELEGLGRFTLHILVS